MVGAGVLIEKLVGINFTLSVLITGTFMLCYVVFGGMKAVALSDTLYGAGLLTAGLLIPTLALFKLGDGDFLAGVAHGRPGTEKRREYAAVLGLMSRSMTLRDFGESSHALNRA